MLKNRIHQRFYNILTGRGIHIAQKIKLHNKTDLIKYSFLSRKY